MNPVETVLFENIDKPSSCFVFPTDISASRWADHLLRIKGGAIAMNKFIAWDVFKQNSIKSKVQNKKSIPSSLRKIFVNRLLNENAQEAEKGIPLFSSLIREQWAAQSGHFASWLTRILPQLGSWFEKTSKINVKNILNVSADDFSLKYEGDDRDLFVLAMRYAHFLEENSLFEPAWETPPFNDEGKEVFIFFPESLSDYGEYKKILSSSEHVKIISIQDAEKLPCDTFFYTNSRREITEAALYIRALHEKKGVKWSSIAVCVSDSQNYEPYVMREFSNRNIPFVKRTSKPLTEFRAGRLFRSIADCVQNDYSFSSLVNLIMNKDLPWKDTDKINSLISFGIKNNCFYSWTEKANNREHKINVWEDAFNKPLDGIAPGTRIFFERLKYRLQEMRSAASFSELRMNYFIFREQFFDMERCSFDSDLVLSRCISELTSLAELEKDFPNVPAADPFLFFSEYLNEIPYLARSKTDGVSILPYKTAASAPFDCHIVLGAGQENLSVVYSRLDFLPRKKRENLNIFDEDASNAFINLHKINSMKNAAFFCSEKTFKGFSIPHSKIGSPSEPAERYAEEKKDEFSVDCFREEREFLSALKHPHMYMQMQMQELHEIQVNGFLQWKNRRNRYSDSKQKWIAGKKVKELIKSKYEIDGKTNVSASSLQPYFNCSLKWLFERVFALANVQIETSLMAENTAGTVYHGILNVFFNEIKNKKKRLLPPDDSSQGYVLPCEYLELLEDSIDKVFNEFSLKEPSSKFYMSALTARLLYAQKADFRYNLEKFIVQFLSFFAGCTVAGTEISYKSERDSFMLNGIVDCILKDELNNLKIIDFKLKNLPERKDCTGEGEKGLSNFQLPMYTTLAEENEKIKTDTALFFSILEPKPETLFGVIQDIDGKIKLPKKEENRITRESERYNKIFKEFNKKVMQFSQEIPTGDFSVFETKSVNCYGCSYNQICRTTYVLAAGIINGT